METTKKSYREIQRFNQSVIHNFEVSVVIPFYHELEAFKKVLPKNAPYLQRNGIEVIIVVDEPTEQKGLIELIKQYPFINWKVIVNKEKHATRSHASVLNVGIRHATKKYILVSDPEMEFHTDVILQLRELLENYPGYYATGTVAFVEDGTKVNADNRNLLNWMNYGSIMVKKKELEAIGGYDEHFKVWGGEDDNIRRRLDMSGIKHLKVPQTKSLHREEKLLLNERFAKTNNFGTKEWQAFFYPKTAKVNNENWGKDFNTIVYDWQNNQYAEELCKNYLKDFLQYEIKDSSVFKTKYKKVILCQAYNENEFMPGFLEDMANYFDGIILLDDDSTDNTWELAEHGKILLKARKKRDCFNDLENRNILLNLASFFKAEWFCFMDIDERFDDRFADFSAFENNENIQIVAFRYVDLWNDEEYYKANPVGLVNGILRRMRMFRNIGKVQINTQQHKLHFAPIPHRLNIHESIILFKHYGNIKDTHRKKKYEFYKREDTHTDLKSYEDLLEEGILREVKKINTYFNKTIHCLDFTYKE